MDPLCMLHRDRRRDGSPEHGRTRNEGKCMNCGERNANQRGYCRLCYQRMMHPMKAVLQVSDAKYGVLCIQEDERSYF